jgi:hypothetical protein
MANPPEYRASQVTVGSHTMGPDSSELYILDLKPSIADLEQQLLNLGPMPRIDESPWSEDQWVRYRVIVCDLAQAMESAALAE